MIVGSILRLIFTSGPTMDTWPRHDSFYPSLFHPAWINDFCRSLHRSSKCIAQNSFCVIILGLQPVNYVKEPEDDVDVSQVGDIYVFGADQNRDELYIKLKCATTRERVCISFHRAEWPLTYPYREEEE